MGPKVLLADDHRILTEALSLKLSEHFDVIGTCSTGHEVLAALEKQMPDVIVMDVSMPEMNGIEAAKRISAKYPRLPIVFLSMHAERPYVEEALRAGGRAFVLKRQAASALEQGIRAAMAGERHVSDGAWQPPPNLPEKRHEVLTPRQREVLQLTSEGKSAKEIGAILHISPKTVEFHKANLMDQLGLRSIAELTRYAVEHLFPGE